MESCVLLCPSSPPLHIIKWLKLNLTGWSEQHLWNIHQDFCRAFQKTPAAGQKADMVQSRRLLVATTPLFYNSLCLECVIGHIVMQSPRWANMFCRELNSLHWWHSSLGTQQIANLAADGLVFTTLRQHVSLDRCSQTVLVTDAAILGGLGTLDYRADGCCETLLGAVQPVHRVTVVSRLL